MLNGLDFFCRLVAKVLRVLTATVVKLYSAHTGNTSSSYFLKSLTIPPVQSISFWTSGLRFGDVTFTLLLKKEKKTNHFKKMIERKYSGLPLKKHFNPRDNDTRDLNDFRLRLG